MHASILELLSLRDGEPVAAAMAQHVDRCAQCTAEVSRLQSVRERLRAVSLPAAQTLHGRRPTDGEVDELWQRVQQSLVSARPGKASPNRYLAIAAGAVWAAVALVWFVLAGGESSSVQPNLPSSVVPLVSLETLVTRSQDLESVLLELPQRPQVEQAATAATIDALEGRIQWLDYSLSHAAASGIPPDQATVLWQDRVELLDSLVTLRYAQAVRLSF